MVHSLARHPGHVKNRDQLMRDAEPGGGRRHRHLAREAHPRKFLAADPAFDAIETVYGLGYRWKSLSVACRAFRCAPSCALVALVLLVLPWAG